MQRLRPTGECFVKRVTQLSEEEEGSIWAAAIEILDKHGCVAYELVMKQQAFFISKSIILILAQHYHFLPEPQALETLFLPSAWNEKHTERKL